jgi:glycolate oxidase iron-sulfur subunit
METTLAPEFQGTRQGAIAQEILRRCVHCGFCTATCPTYQVLGDELDGPRGRIYMIKQMVEGAPVARETQLHLDRCLTCRNCETTCPSGVEYGKLVDVGREIIEHKVSRPIGERLMRTMLKVGLTSPLFAPAMRMGQSVRSLLPATLRQKVPAYRHPGRIPTRDHARKVLLLKGCVQPAMLPGIDAATRRVLDALGIASVVAPGSGCCGAIKHHLSDLKGGLESARRNIDAWWPAINSGSVESIVINASGCGVMVKDYGHLLADDPAYAEKARRISAAAKDPIELLESLLDELKMRMRERDANHHDGLGGHAGQPAKTLGDRVAFHPPCTLQHGMKMRGVVEKLLSALGAELVPVTDSHLCCGSAGTYSVLQPELSSELKRRKLKHLQAKSPDVILSANIGCITHLESGAAIPVRHWLEWIDERLPAA